MNEDNATVTPVDGALRKSFNDVITAAESLMRATVDQTNSEYRNARAALDAKLAAAKERIAEDVQGALGGAKEIGDKGDRLVRSNPWIAVGVGTVTGLLLGLLLRRR